MGSSYPEIIHEWKKYPEIIPLCMLSRPKKKNATRKATDNGKRLMLYSTDPSVITTPVMQEKKISWRPAKKRGSLPIFGA